MMQGDNIDTAVHWLSVASNNKLMLLAAKAERFLLQAAERLSNRSEAEHISQCSLLHMLDSHQAAIKRMQQAAGVCANKCDYAEAPQCPFNHRAAMPDAVTDAIIEIRLLKPSYPNVM